MVDLTAHTQDVGFELSPILVYLNLILVQAEKILVYLVAELSGQCKQADVLRCVVAELEGCDGGTTWAKVRWYGQKKIINAVAGCKGSDRVQSSLVSIPEHTFVWLWSIGIRDSFHSLPLRRAF